MLKQGRQWLCLSGLVFACGSVGCASTRVETPRVADVSKSLADRTGHVPRDEEAGLVPPAVSFDEGLTEDEAVGIALWNHPGFHTDLASLGFSRADVVEAGLLRNPILSLLFPLGSASRSKPAASCRRRDPAAGTRRRCRFQPPDAGSLPALRQKAGLNTKTQRAQRHKEGRHQRLFKAAFFVSLCPLCLCV